VWASAGVRGSQFARLRWLHYSMYRIERWQAFVTCCHAVKMLCAGGGMCYVFTRFGTSVVKRHEVLPV